ncbi:hypothetical protein NTGM5_480096 [Candidatus Nitrotoga sp. M5]|nr:hypothetical protein NTGM5_480096 [Candidatus Nitrotoga sp. M5]
MQNFVDHTQKIDAGLFYAMECEYRCLLRKGVNIDFAEINLSPYYLTNLIILMFIQKGG